MTRLRAFFAVGAPFMHQEHSTYVELGCSDDFGLTGLAERLCSHRTVDLPLALGIAADAADGSDGEEAVEPGEDARRLLNGPVSEEALHCVWLAAAGRGFDPADHGMDTRTWLRAISDLATDRLRRNRWSRRPTPMSASGFSYGP